MQGQVCWRYHTPHHLCRLLSLFKALQQAFRKRVPNPQVTKALERGWQGSGAKEGWTIHPRTKRVDSRARISAQQLLPLTLMLRTLLPSGSKMVTWGLVLILVPESRFQGSCFSSALLWSRPLDRAVLDPLVSKTSKTTISTCTTGKDPPSTTSHSQ